MELGHYDIEELLLAAMKSEIESKELYSKIAKITQNGLLQDKLEFLSNEEEKHRLIIEEIYKNHFPDNEIKIPKESPVPLPKITIDEESPVSKLLQMAMRAEQKASEFYKNLAERFETGSKIHNTLIYFSNMEIGHYKILENEKESMDRFEEEDVYWPMIHAGP